MANYRVIMIRHGESEWNSLNLFCGWFDANLSAKGQQEALNCAKIFREKNISFDFCFTSILQRAKNTLAIIVKELNVSVPIVSSWHLNERHYGALTGLNKVETAKKYGENQVQIWRRSFDVPPPPMEKEHKHYTEIRENLLNKESDGPSEEQFPLAESLKLTIERTMPFWTNKIVPVLRNGKTVLIVAHGNSLRGIVKELEQLSEAEIMELNLPTGIPFVYELDENLKPVKSREFLVDEATLKAQIEAVQNQAKIR